MQPQFWLIVDLAHDLLEALACERVVDIFLLGIWDADVIGYVVLTADPSV